MTGALLHLPISRRQLLQMGGIGALGLTLPSLLRAGQGSVGRSGPERSCLFIVQYGGASQIDTFDPKPLAPEDVRGPYRPIATRTSGLEICELPPRLAMQSDQFAVVRSMTHENGGHDGGMHVAMTGHSVPTVDTPYFGSVISGVRPATRNMPSYVWLQNLAGDVEPSICEAVFLARHLARCEWEMIWIIRVPPSFASPHLIRLRGPPPRNCWLVVSCFSDWIRRNRSLLLRKLGSGRIGRDRDLAGFKNRRSIW